MSSAGHIHSEDSAVEDFRSTIVGFLADHLPPGWTGLGALPESEQAQFRDGWRRTLVQNGLLGVSWPEQYGGAGMSVANQSSLAEEFAKAGVPPLPHPNDSFGFNLLAPTLLHWGTDEQKERFLPPTLSGEIRWAQGYSEPEAGSDLFNLRTTGVIEGDQVVINGQKIWQTAGTSANWLFTLVRTDPTQSRGRGISFILVDLDQPGVTVRPIPNITGSAEFAEVFFSDARASVRDVVGGLNNGSKVALTLLAFERGVGGLAAAIGLQLELGRLRQLAAARGRWASESVRERFGACRSEVEALRALAARSLEAGVGGKPPGSESSIIKLRTAEYRQRVTELAMDILGLEGLAPTGPAPAEWGRPQPRGFDALSSRGWVNDYLNARAGTIYGGSSEIQRNTIAEQVLGLPREPRQGTQEKGSGS